jgi:ethanolamine utilization protein EutQ (cupin superfamily)
VCTVHAAVPLHVSSPTVVPGIGEKVIRELVGRANTDTGEVSVARMTSPAGWTEPAQAPEFDEVTVVLEGAVVVEHDGGELIVRAGEAVLARAGERIRYSTPEGAEYIAVCVPAFSPETVHRVG